MLRRHAISVLLAALADVPAKASARLDHYLDPGRGAALLLDVRTRRVVAINSNMVAGRTLAPPGSTAKPFVLSALLRKGKLNSTASFVCPTRLTIGKRRFDCTHPPLLIPMHLDTALAYSCNCFVANVAERFAPGELSKDLESLGFASRTGLIAGDEASGRVEPSTTPDAVRAQALGEAGVLVTPLELALAYRQLALRTNAPDMQPILQGLEGAVEFGTAQQARVGWAKLAGKTGSTRSATGEHIAWFAGFLPSRAPEIVVTVMLSGRSGGSDAAPVASQLLEAYHAGRL